MTDWAAFSGFLSTDVFGGSVGWVVVSLGWSLGFESTIAVDSVVGVDFEVVVDFVVVVDSVDFVVDFVVNFVDFIVFVVDFVVDSVVCISDFVVVSDMVVVMKVVVSMKDSPIVQLQVMLLSYVWIKMIFDCCINVFLNAQACDKLTLTPFAWIFRHWDMWFLSNMCLWSNNTGMDPNDGKDKQDCLSSII